MITVEEIKLAIQCMVNSYKGEYGKVVKVFNDPQCFKIRFVEGFTAVQGDTLYIVHQGSHEWKDWMYDFMAWHSKVKKITAYGHINSDIEVHTGFNTEHQIDINRILDLVKAHPECKEVKTYGHSLGAAISTLTAIDIKTAFPDRNVTCITGGSPRVGNDTFVEVWNKLIPNSIRLVNGNDVVTKVPPEAFGYKHINTLLAIGKTHWYAPMSTNNHYPGDHDKHYGTGYMGSFNDYVAKGGKIPTVG